jgi:crotonobetainyl-CoA:carnitine CoA-transferase CaiB-like acyl-CoA transferase
MPSEPPRSPARGAGPPPPEAAGALAGLRVLDLGNMIAGPFCARLLADLGADVIKVEQPGRGDPVRGWRSQYRGHSLLWKVMNRNKRAITLDLHTEDGQALARRLYGAVDVVVENFRPGILERWGLAHRQVQEACPRLIMVRISGYGQTGPYRDRAGFGGVAEAVGGVRVLTGYPDRPPTRVGFALADTVAGLYGAYAALAALEERRRSGRGQEVDVALTEAVFSLLDDLLPAYQKLGIVGRRHGTGLPGVAPSGIYPTRDAQYIVIGANNDNVFRRLARLMGREDWLADPGLAHDQGRGRRQAEIDAAVGAWTAQSSLRELDEALARAGVPAGPAYDIAGIAADPQFRERGMIAEVDDPEVGPLAMPGIVPRLSRTPGRIARAGPRMGQHNEEVYGALLGLPEDEIAGLRARGVI